MDRRHVIGKAPVSSSPARGTSGQGRLRYSLYHGQGPSSYETNSYYEQGERVRYPNHDLDGPSKFENLENCRAELLQKLDELKDHISRSCEMTDQTGARMDMCSPAQNNPYPMNHVTRVQEGLSSSYGAKKQPHAPDDIVYRHAPVIPYPHTYTSSLRDLHLHRGHPHKCLSYADNYQQQMSLGPYNQPQSQYLHQPYLEPHHGYCDNANRDMFMLNRDFQKPTCSCVHCFDKNWDLPVNPSGLYNQRFQHARSNPNYLHHPPPIGHGPQGFSSGDFNLHTSHSQPSITTPNSTELNFENDGIHQNYPRKTEEAYRNRHMLHPVAGGAPLIACTSCFELLRLSKKHISRAKIQQKLQCGACSSIILFELGNKALAVPVSASLDRGVTEMDGFPSNTVDENVRYQRGDSNSANMDAFSDLNSNSLPAEKKSNSGEFEKQLDPVSSASSLSPNQQLPNSSTSEKYGSSAAELHVSELESFPHPILTTEDSPDQHSANIVVDQFDNGKKDKKAEFDDNVPWQNSVRDSAVSTEIDMSSKEFTRTFMSQDSVDEIKEQHLRDDKGAESSSSGHIKNISGDSTKSAENAEYGISQVFVNGHPIPEHLVQKAELLAGPIQPGDYWYDIDAGFWGVMGYPCLGIVMPNIEEFNYPMPVNCAAGNTEVYVNGRELHQKDLDLLAGRGLPETRQRYYLIEISGRVVDEDTEEELDNIGKLAPTVERAKHGFGMKVPRFITRLQG